MQPPLSQKNIIRILAVTIVLLALTAGYYHSVLDVYKKKYNRLELELLKTQAQLEKAELQ